MGDARTVPEIVPLDVTTEIELEPAPSWVLAPTVGLDMVTICGEGGLESDEESNELGEDSVWGLEGL